MSSGWWAAAVAGLQTIQAPAQPDADIVVAARSAALPPLLEPMAHLRRFCFDPLRLSGRFAPPTNDTDWRALDVREARGFGPVGPGVSAYGLTDPKRGYRLVIKFETTSGERGWHTIVERCTLVVTGGRGHDRFAGDMAALFRASGTQRHVGEREGAPKLVGWTQLMWSGMPSRRSDGWRALRAGERSAQSAWLKVVEPRFYDEYDYILGDLKTRNDPVRPASLLTFAHVRREGANEKGRPLSGPPSPATPIR